MLWCPFGTIQNIMEFHHLAELHFSSDKKIVGTPLPGCPKRSAGFSGHPGTGVPTELPKKKSPGSVFDPGEDIT
jgi:hypothetical protein